MSPKGGDQSRERKEAPSAEWATGDDSGADGGVAGSGSGEADLPLPKRRYRTGTINRLSNVDEARPPRITTAMGYSIS